MKGLSKFFLLAILSSQLLLKGVSILAGPVDSGLIIYNAPSGADKNKDFTVQVRKEGGKWCYLFGYNAVDMNKGLYPGVIYYVPGFHKAGSINLSSGGTIYLAGGAIVWGDVRGTGISNASIRDNGILENGGIRIINSSHITIEGIIIIDSPGWCIVPSQVGSSIIRDIKIINKGVSTDGSDLSGYRNLTFDNVFYRIPDDCISIIPN